MIRILKGRSDYSKILVNKSQMLIKLANKTYGNIVDNGLNEHSNKLNLVMRALTAFTVSFIPF